MLQTTLLVRSAAVAILGLFPVLAHADFTPSAAVAHTPECAPETSTPLRSSRWALSISRSNVDQSVRSGSGAIETLYNFTSTGVGIGYRPNSQLMITGSYSMDNGGGLTHEAGKELEGEYSPPSYEKLSISVDARALTGARWQLHALGGIDVSSTSVVSRTKGNTIYPLHDLDPVSSEITLIHGGAKVVLRMQRHLHLSAAYEMTYLLDQQLGHRDPAIQGIGAQLGIAANLELPGGFFMEGALTSEFMRSTSVEMTRYESRSYTSSVHVGSWF